MMIGIRELDLYLGMNFGRLFRICLNPLEYNSDKIVLYTVMAKVVPKSACLHTDLRQNLDESNLIKLVSLLGLRPA